MRSGAGLELDGLHRQVVPLGQRVLAAAFQADLAQRVTQAVGGVGAVFEFEDQARDLGVPRGRHEGGLGRLRVDLHEVGVVVLVALPPVEAVALVVVEGHGLDVLGGPAEVADLNRVLEVLVVVLEHVQLRRLGAVLADGDEVQLALQVARQGDGAADVGMVGRVVEQLGASRVGGAPVCVHQVDLAVQDAEHAAFLAGGVVDVVVGHVVQVHGHGAERVVVRAVLDHQPVEALGEVAGVCPDGEDLVVARGGIGLVVLSRAEVETGILPEGGDAAAPGDGVIVAVVLVGFGNQHGVAPDLVGAGASFHEVHLDL